MKRIPLAASLAPVLLLGLLASGCVSGRMSIVFRQTGIPERGQPIAEEIWAKAESVSPDRAVAATNNFTWPFPLIVAKRHVEITADRQSAVDGTFRMVGLGVPYFYLPLYIKADEIVHERGAAEPVGRATRSWNPFWPTETSEGKSTGNLESESTGVPILFESIEESGHAWYFDENEWEWAPTIESRFCSSLWWFGPAYWDYREVRPDSEHGRQVNEGTYFIPLLLMRLPGVLLWSDYKTKSADDRGVLTREGHGPLFGALTYMKQGKEQSDGRTEDVTLVGGGALWLSSRETAPGSDEVADATYGPLWGALGWGRRDGRPVVRVLFVTIPVGPAR